MTSDSKNPVEETASGAEGAHNDVQSDPADATADDSGDWAGEGGATETGPATDS